MTPRRRAGPQGWTLVEAVLVALIFLVVMTGVMVFLNTQSDFWEYSTTQTDGRADVERAVTEMAKELRLARRVTAGTAPNITIPASPGNTTMTFYVPTDMDGSTGVLDSIGNVEWNTNNPIQFTYDAASQQLRRIEGGVVTRVLGTDIAAATFSDQAIDNTLLSNEVKIAATLQRITPHRRTVTTSATTIVKLRN